MPRYFSEAKPLTCTPPHHPRAGSATCERRISAPAPTHTQKKKTVRCRTEWNVKIISSSNHFCFSKHTPIQSPVNPQTHTQPLETSISNTDLGKKIRNTCTMFYLETEVNRHTGTVTNNKYTWGWSTVDALRSICHSEWSYTIHQCGIKSNPRAFKLKHVWTCKSSTDIKSVFWCSIF